MSAVMSDQQPNNNMAEFFSPGPGERLRAARLSMGYDLPKIAGELHLTSPVVEMLEADEYSEIGARVFVRGYLRNYARIVGMPVESILRQFDEKWPDEVAGQSMLRESPTLPADGGPSRGWAGAMTWLLIVCLLILFLMWWRGYLDEIVPEQIRTGNLSSDTVGNDAKLAPLDGQEDILPLDDLPADGGLGLPAFDPAGVGMPGTAGEGQDPAPALRPDAGGALSLDVAPTVVLPSTGDGALTLPAAVETPAPVSQPMAATDRGAPVVGATPQVVLTFSAPCWVDVRDSERSFKLFGEMPEGSRRVLGGTPPYKFIVGNAGAVEITVNGRPFDLKPYARGNVARFTLDP